MAVLSVIKSHLQEKCCFYHQEKAESCPRVCVKRINKIHIFVKVSREIV